ALLLFPPDDFFRDLGGPRSAEWLNVLEEASRHDPDNALYDYLAAIHLWRASVEYDFHPHYDRGLREVEIMNQELFRRAMEFAKRGPSKPFLTAGFALDSVKHEFVRFARVSSVEASHIVMGRNEAAERGSGVVNDFFSQLRVLRDYAIQQDDIQSVLETIEWQTPLLAQVLATDESIEQHINASLLAEPTLHIAKHFNATYPGATEMMQPTQLRSSLITWKVWREALNRIPDEEEESTALFFNLLVMKAGLRGAVLLIALAIVAVLISRILHTSESRISTGFGFLRILVSFAFGTLFSFVVFGLAPAKVISTDVQGWTVLMIGCLFILGVILVLFWGLGRLLARRHERPARPSRLIQFSLGGLLRFTALFGVLLAIWIHFDLGHKLFFELRPHLSMPATSGWSGIDGDRVKEMYVAKLGAFGWLMLQWILYHGISIAASAAVFVAILWHAIRQKKNSNTSSRSRLARVRRWFGNAFAVGGRSALTISLCCLLVYLALVPTVVRAFEEHHESAMALARDPKQAWAPFVEALNDIRSDKQLMDEIRADVDNAIAAGTDESS
ncbi:MAG: hypothetical protein IH991_14265, partial [Planctomycetes bacterium]|nr:hypothetical protein [Planctomycetota bacterium]